MNSILARFNEEVMTRENAWTATGIITVIALREFRKQTEKGESLWRAVRSSKDPATFTVLFEDAAALLGLLAAFAGIFLSHRLDLPWVDGATSIVIGLILGSTAGFLAYESKGLLVGEGADPKTLEAIRRHHPEIKHIYIEAGAIAAGQLHELDGDEMNPRPPGDADEPRR